MAERASGSRGGVGSGEREIWPELHYSDWADTCTTLHRWTQVVGKIQLALNPMANHWWHATLHLNARGFGTQSITCDRRCIELDFDFIDHALCICTSDGQQRSIALRPRSVASFYHEVMATLASLDVRVRIWPVPMEILDPIPLDQDEVHAAYDAEYAQRFWRVLVACDRVLQTFRSRFVGKASPVQLFWGALDLAYTRFSGRLAPTHPGVAGVPDFVTREAYSHEVSSCGFWPGSAPGQDAAFYAYAYPEPPGYREARVLPSQAFYSPDLGEYLLPYEAVRTAQDPDQVLLDFLQTTYEAAAVGGCWDTAALERSSDRPPDRTA